MKHFKQRQQLLSTTLAMTEAGLSKGSSGNLSIRLEEGFLITPSAMLPEDCEAEDMVEVAADGTSNDKHSPSSEWRFHRDIYEKYPDANAVLHAHSLWCTTLACLGNDIPAFHYMIAVAGGNSIRCTEYEPFGTEELSTSALAALEDRNACLLGNHGLLCFNGSLGSVLQLAEEVEELCQQYAQTLQIGQPNILTDEQMDDVIERFKNYKQMAPR